MEMYLQRKEYKNMTNGKKGSKLPSCEARAGRGVQRHQSCTVKNISKESAVWGDVREGVKGSVRAEVRGARNATQNRVSPDNFCSSESIVSEGIPDIF